MTLLQAVRTAALAPATLIVLTLGCGMGFNGSDVLVLTQVNVMGGNGSAEVMFQGIAGQELQISLVGLQPGMIPRAILIGPDGGQSDAPPLASASNGINSAQVTLPRSGTYRLDVFDASGHGGGVTVRVELAPSVPTTQVASSRGPAGLLWMAT